MERRGDVNRGGISIEGHLLERSSMVVSLGFAELSNVMHEKRLWNSHGRCEGDFNGCVTCFAACSREPVRTDAQRLIVIAETLIVADTRSTVLALARRLSKKATSAELPHTANAEIVTKTESVDRTGTAVF